MFKEVTNKDIEVFKKILDDKRVLVGENIPEDYSHDEMTVYGSYKPSAVLIVKSTEEVSEVMGYCYKEGIAVTPRGAGTGLCGACVAVNGGIILSTHEMKEIIEIDHDTMSCVIEPGVLLMEIIDRCANEGLLYAPDPGEKSATVGGNIATNAGGMRAIKYGVTRDYVKGLEVVLSDGRVMMLGGKVAKNSSGYSLKDLIIGSEGTLGIVTKIIMKLLPKPKMMTSLLIPFDSLNEALDLVPKIMKLEELATTIEFMEKEVIDDAIEYLGKDFPNNEHNAYLIVSYSGNSKKSIEPMIEACADLALANGAIDVFISDTEERQSSIWDARGAFLEAIKNSTTEMDECDVVVNINKVSKINEFAKELSIKENIRIRVFGHAGDGNLHIYVLKDDLDDEIWEEKCKRCMDALYRKASEMSGQVSGEHGIGHAKKEYLKDSLEPVQIELMKRIKEAFDPKGILNPGKVID